MVTREKNDFLDTFDIRRIEDNIFSKDDFILKDKFEFVEQNPSDINASDFSSNQIMAKSIKKRFSP